MPQLDAENCEARINAALSDLSNVNAFDSDPLKASKDVQAGNAAETSAKTSTKNSAETIAGNTAETVEGTGAETIAGAITETAVENAAETKAHMHKSSNRKGLSGKHIETIASAILFTAGLIFIDTLSSTYMGIPEYVVFLTAYLLAGRNVLLAALRGIKRGIFFDENTLMSIATIGAIAIHELPEAVGVMLFYSVGEILQDAAIDRSRKSIAALVDIRPRDARVIEPGTGRIIEVNPEAVKIGSLITVRVGERIPLDGIVREGESTLDTSALTGESLPKDVGVGDEALAGMVNISGLLTIEVTREYKDTTLARIIDLVENAAGRKAHAERFITRFARYYTPIVVFAAAGIAFIPPIFIQGATLSDWVYRALILLVISCPCALVTSIPLGYFGGIGAMSKAGVLVKGANYLEALADVESVVFDKTGTLTKGSFVVTEIEPIEPFDRESLLQYAAMAEFHSKHPIAESILKAYGRPVDVDRVEGFEEIPGKGVTAHIDGKRVAVGSRRFASRVDFAEGHVDFMEDHNDEIPAIYVAVDGKPAGRIIISDEVKDDAPATIEGLKKLGIKKTYLLTGDNPVTAELVRSKLGIDVAFSELLPDDKVTKLEEIKNGFYSDTRNSNGKFVNGKTGNGITGNVHTSKNDNTGSNNNGNGYNGRKRRGKVAFVGDGINDAPVIVSADVGIAMGGLGSDAAIEAADAVIMDDKPYRLIPAIKIARKTRNIVVQNIIFSLAAKGVLFALGAAGAANIWGAVFADVGVTLVAILNSARILGYRG